MANTSDILSDPDFVNANAATKQAIFDKHVSNDPSFTSANTQTQNAIRTRFGLAAPTGGIPVGRQGAAGIPTEPGANLTPTATEPRSLYQRVMGNIETLPALAGGAVGGVVAPIAQLGHELTQGQAFTPEGKAAAAKFGQQVQQQFYQPRTEEAQRNVQAIGEAIIPMAGLHMGGPVNALAPVTQAVGDITQNALSTARATPLGQAIAAPIAARAERKQAANISQSYQNAGRIEAANKGSDIGLVASPAAMNPTKTNKAKAFLTDPKVIDAAAAESNAIQVPKLALNEMGLPPNTALNSDAPFIAAREAASGPYKVVSSLPSLSSTPEIINSLEPLRPNKLVLGKDRAASLNEIINTAKQDISDGLTGAEAIKSINDLRAQAQAINNSQKAGHPVPASELDKVNAYRGIADTLEQLVENNVTDPKVLSDLRAARVKIAKIHAYEDATDFNTGQINPAELAKATSKNSNLTGDIATIGQFAGNFPEAMGLTTPEAAAAAVKRTLSRATLSGALGAGIGSMVGVGPAVGLAAGAGLGQLGSQFMAKRMVSPKYQSANAIPTDYRTNMLRPVEPNYGPNQMVPYVAPTEVLSPGQGTQFQNFTMQGEPTFGAAPTPYAQRSLPNEVPKQIYQAEKNADLAQEFRAAAERKPMGRELQFDLDPITGKLVPTSAGVRGATPEVFQADTGVSLKSATDKVASGQQFSMSAAEKVAWDKTRVDLASVAPEFKSLSQKELSAKMMDRQWVSDAIAKIREKAQAFDDITKRSKNAQAVRNAAMQREKMIDLLSDLEDSLRPSRPVSGTAQGPKTRAAQRNQLMSGQASKNALAP